MSGDEAEISSIIAAWEEENGVELDDEQFQELGEAIAAQADEHGSYDIDQLAEHHGIVEYEDDGGVESLYEPPERDNFVENVQRDFVRLENKLGRRLTQREVDAVSAGIADQDQRNVAIDAQAAFDDSYEQAGEKPPDLMNRQDRRKWIAEKLQDDRAANAPEEPARDLDLDNKADRLEYMTARMNGTEFTDAPAEEA